MRVMTSIHPHWVEEIISGKKLWEIRKTAPKKVPFVDLIYETKVGGGRGKVIGEFVCDQIVRIQPFLLSNEDPFVRETCVPLQDIREYLGDKGGYAWHISDLKIYDEPKELSEFKIKRKCNSCQVSGYESSGCQFDKNCIVSLPLTRPPQSWGYIDGE